MCGRNQRDKPYISNHTSAEWPEKQIKALDEIIPDAKIYDIKLEKVDTSEDEKSISNKAKNIINEIGKNFGGEIEQKFGTAIVQGEYTLTFLIVQHLLKGHVKCYSAVGEGLSRCPRFGVR